MANYLYNGVELPDIHTVYTPEIQEQYPYAVLRASIDGQSYGLYLSEELPYFKEDGTLIIAYANLSQLISVRNLRYNFWRDPIPGMGDGWGVGHYSTIGVYVDKEDVNRVFWTNTDILNLDGSVFLAASDPVPTYDPTALLQGYLVGCRLRAQRRKQ